MSIYNNRYVISLLIADRVGILSSLTASVTDLGANIEGISQTVVQGYFTVIMIAAFREPVTEDALRTAILSHFHKDEASVMVRACETTSRTTSAGERYILTMSGKDRPGILKALTTYLADKKINVEDLFFRISGEHVTHIGEVTVPPILDIKQVQDELAELMTPRGLVVRLQHENIFRATNEVGAIRFMLKEPRHVSN